MIDYRQVTRALDDQVYLVADYPLMKLIRDKHGLKCTEEYLVDEVDENSKRQRFRRYHNSGKSTDIQHLDVNQYGLYTLVHAEIPTTKPKTKDRPINKVLCISKTGCSLLKAGWNNSTVPSSFEYAYSREYQRFHSARRT